MNFNETKEQKREVAMKSREVIRGVLDEFEDTQINMGSEMAREILAHKIYKKLSKHYFIFKKNETLVDPELDAEFHRKVEERRKQAIEESQ